MLQAAGDRPLFFKEDDGHPGCTREMGVEDVLILSGGTSFGNMEIQEMLHVQKIKRISEY